MKSSIFSFFAIILLFSACCKEKLSEEAQLIAAIQAATDKQEIALEALPISSKTVLDLEHKESFTKEKLLAPGLGYEIIMQCVKENQFGDLTAVYFDLDGHKLVQDSDKKDKEWYDKEGYDKGEDKEDCFKLVYPVDFTMPDGAVVELSVDENGENWDEMKEWYEANPLSKEKPELVYPVEIQLDETTLETVNNETEMIEWKKSCE